MPPTAIGTTYPLPLDLGLLSSPVRHDKMEEVRECRADTDKMGKDGDVGGRGSEEGGHAPPSADKQGRTRSSVDSTTHIDYLIFRSKLILAFNNLSRTEESLGSLSRGRQPEVPVLVRA